MSHRQIEDIGEVRRQAEEFVNRFKRHFLTHLPDNIFNTDQTGFNLEFLSGRTLETRGSISVEGRIRSSFSATHSYTIMPVISASGQLHSPMFVILQEKSGEFGARVQQSMFQHDSLHVVASKSGKITNDLMERWFLDIFFKMSPKSVLLVDSLGSYKDRVQIDASKPETVEYILEMLPPGTTATAQPLDVYFFRQYKSFMRRLSNEINFHHPEIKLNQRNTILKLQALVHGQFSSPRFSNFIKYAWFKSNYITEKPPHESPMTFCFKERYACCIKIECDQIAFVCCGWCKEDLCFHHFYDTEGHIHYCRNYLE